MKLSSLPLLFIATIITPSSSFAILDFIGDTARDAAKSAAYVDAVGELAGELDDSSEIAEGAKDLEGRLRKIHSSASDVYYVSSEFKSLLNGPDWSSQRLDQNIRYTARYVSRLKRLLVSLGLVGTDVATAMNTAETNGALKEVLKNQQAQLLLQKEEQVSRAEGEIGKTLEWENFIRSERALRSEKVNQ